VRHRSDLLLQSSNNSHLPFDRVVIHW
jgi:hypothetical protein